MRSVRHRYTTPLLTGGLLAAGAVGSLVTAGTAFAAYPPYSPVCTMASAPKLPNAPVTITGVGFPAGATVTVSGTGVAKVPVPTVVTGSDGSLKVVEKTGPTSGTGQYTLSGTTTSATCTVRSFTVEPLVITPTPSPTATSTTAVPTPPDNGPLAFTGAEGIGIMSVLGAGLIAGGAAFVVVGRRRRSEA